MKIVIKGKSGSGKSYFFLPELIKLLKPKRVFQIKTSIENHGGQNSPHWSPIKWEFYNKDVLLNEKDLIFIDELFFIENKKELELINKHNNVVISCASEINLQKWLENLKDYLVIDSRYIKPNGFPKNIFNCPVKKEKKELRKLIDNKRWKTTK